MLRRRKLSVGLSWLMDETYIKVSGECKYLYRAVVSGGHTIDLLLRTHGDLDLARCLLERPIDQHASCTACPRRS